MKTVVCEQPYQLVLKDTEKPAVRAGEALVRIRRVGICGTDLHAYRGNQPFFEYPRVLGHELAGEIAEIGDNAQGLRKGDTVAVIPYLECGNCIACRSGKPNCCVRLNVLGVHQDGGMREYLAVPADHLLRADGLRADQAAVVECFAIGAHAVRRAALMPGEFALVIGAGPIGLGVMKFARLAGARVIAMDMNAERLRFCRQWAPADYVVDASGDPLLEIAAITGGDYPTAVFDATGSARSMGSALQYAAHSGRLVYVGLTKGEIAFANPEFHKRELTILGSRNATREDFEQVMGSMRRGEIDTDAFITHRVGFDGMISAFESWLSPEAGVIKAMVEL
jgi:2-desacetyl-2-hydroxyethyl bacteriochlorophyllide A dehydrogenase